MVRGINMRKKVLVIGIIFLFLGMICHPTTSLEIKNDEEKKDADCNCIKVDELGRPICDLLYEKILDIDLKLGQIGEKLDQLEEGSTIYNIYALYALMLLYRVSFLELLWDAFNCDYEQFSAGKAGCNCQNIGKLDRPICDMLKNIILIIKDNYVYYMDVYNDGSSTRIEKGISLFLIAAYSEFYSLFLDINEKYNCPDPFQ